MGFCYSKVHHGNIPTSLDRHYLELLMANPLAHCNLLMIDI